MKPSVIAFKRCRPLLGTYVQISITAHKRSHDLPKLNRLIHQAYRCIESISGLMSFHDTESELFILNHAPVGMWMRLSKPTITVLSLALRLQNHSGGRFNVAV